MILKGSQRAGGQELALHLLKTENEHVLVHELRGFAAGDLPGAFKEAEAIAKGTRCSQYLFSLSLNPPAKEAVGVGVFEDTISRIEQRLGLSGQPRAIVFHEKEGRRHAHCVWSRIDAQTMTARPMSFFKSRLTEISRDLYLENGWAMPSGIAFPGGRDPTNYSLAEWQQAKRLGQDPRWIKSIVQDCWSKSDDGRSFTRALESCGLFLAKGDKRALVVIGHDGEVHSLPRALGVKTKDVKARLGDGAGLKSVAETLVVVGRRMRPAIRRHIEEKTAADRVKAEKLAAVMAKAAKLHGDERKALHARLDREWQTEVRARAASLPTGVRAFWQRLTGQYKTQLAAHEREAALTRERQANEREALVNRQLEQRRGYQAEIDAWKSGQAGELLELRKEVGRYLAFAGEREARLDGPAQGRSLALKLTR